MNPSASILAVGSELLGTTRLDTNSLFLTGELEAIGIRVVRKACVVDGWDDLLAELSFGLSRAPLLCVTGGLGPTEDDRTKEAVAALLGRRLVRDEEILERSRRVMAAGASGLVYGRNVIQHEDPAGMVQRLMAIVHG